MAWCAEDLAGRALLDDHALVHEHEAVTNLAGETLVFKASPQFELLVRNPLGERVLASVAVADGEIFVRSYKHLWCIGGPK